MIFLHPVAWLAYMVAVTPLWLLGWPICFALAITQSWEPQLSPYFPRKVQLWRYRWAFLWNSFEDGVTGNTKWMMSHLDWPVWLRAWIWCAWRNPVDATRFVYPFGIQIDPARIRVHGNCENSPQDDWTGERVLWSYVSQGVFAGFWVRWPRGEGAYGQFRIGWRLFPRDARGVPPDDGRVPGCGFALQFHWRRTG